MGSALRHVSDGYWPAADRGAPARGSIGRQRPRCVWFTGLPASGKSTLADALRSRLVAAGRQVAVLDGDVLRQGLNRDLGFSEADRMENVRRAAEAARLMFDAGLIVIAAFISPYRSGRTVARELFPPGGFIEVSVDTPLEVCERRDPKGLYVQARSGRLKNFTGVDSHYEPPEAPELIVRTTETTPQRVAEELTCLLER
jgi:bifunctional enzyme CysN/CysC